jgi:hypothetical protein
MHQSEVPYSGKFSMPFFRCQVYHQVQVVQDSYRFCILVTLLRHPVVDKQTNSFSQIF